MTRPSSLLSLRRSIVAALPLPIASAARDIKRSIKNLRSPERVFKNIHSNNAWDGTESVSGPGSTMAATANIRAALPTLLAELGVKTLLDVPCGDAHWISMCLPKDVRYIGGDIVPAIVESNQRRHADLGEFMVLDLVKDNLPEADMIVVRDCFIHLPNHLILEALRNIKRARVSYILTTSFIDVGENIDIEIGGFRPIDLTLPPFALRKPLCLIAESEQRSKNVALWRSIDL